jgi:hypothetical protein
MSYPTRNDARPATTGQLGFIDSLIASRKIEIDDLPADVFETLLDVGGHKDVTMGEASALIACLKALPMRDTPARADRAAKAEPGYYSLDGDFYVIVTNKAGTSTYAKKMVVTAERFDMQHGRTRAKARWEYAPGIGARLAAAAPLTLEEAAAFGHLHGICAICCKQLTVPASVERGIGPICAARVAGAE